MVYQRIVLWIALGERYEGGQYLQKAVDNLSADIVRVGPEDSGRKEFVRAARDAIFGR